MVGGVVAAISQNARVVDDVTARPCTRNFRQGGRLHSLPAEKERVEIALTE
jgi:hypothetical protein